MMKTNSGEDQSLEKSGDLSSEVNNVKNFRIRVFEYSRSRSNWEKRKGLEKLIYQETGRYRGRV